MHLNLLMLHGRMAHAPWRMGDARGPRGPR
eukprot:SAG31_NODE_13131_length_891_cov_0.680556_1_plen_29_part_10